MYDDAGRLIREVRAEDGQPMREVMTCSYDDTGLKTAVRIFDPVRQHASYAIEGGEMSYTVPGVASMWTEYDRRDLPAEVRFLDVAGELLARVVVTRDSEGRLLEESMHMVAQTFFQPDAAMSGRAEEREELTAMIAAAFPQASFAEATYAYDEHGRVVERRRRMGILSDYRTTCRYDARGNVIEESSEDEQREVALGEDGAPRATPEHSFRQQTRYKYQYDAQGNWTERVVSGRLLPEEDFQRSNVERRTIDYYDPA